jgi:GT2 family glycosyltransferase
MAIAELMQSGRFDAEWYRHQYPDVELSGMSPVEHYLLIGRALSRSTNADDANSEGLSGAFADPLPSLASPPFEGFGTIRHNPLISVLIVSFNSGRDLQALLPTIARQTYRNLEVVVVENGEEDTEPLVARHFANYSYLRADNIGFAEANNIALEMASGELLALINPDTRLEPDMVQNLLDALRFDNEAAVAVPKILFFERFVRLTIRANAPFWIARDELLKSYDYRKLFVRLGLDEGSQILSDPEGNLEIDLPFERETTARYTLNAFKADLNECRVKVGFSRERGKVFDNANEYALDVTFDEAKCSSARYIVNNAGSDLNHQEGPYDRGFGQFDDGAFFSKTYVDAFCGCAALIRRSAILDRKLFIEAFFAYYEDSEISHWLRSHGYRILYQPASVIYHRHSESTSESSSLWRVLVGRSHMLYDIATRREILPPRYFSYKYPEDFQHPLRPKLEKLDALVRSSDSIMQLTRTRRPIACVYNTYFSSMGGGEKHALDIASLLREKYDVFLASEEDFSIDELEQYFAVNLGGVKKLVSTSVNSHFSSKFDLFVNSTFRSNLRSRARKNLYIVSFPHADLDASLIDEQIFAHNSEFTARWANEYWGKHNAAVMLPILGQGSLFEGPPREHRKEKSILSVGRITSAGHCKNHHKILEAFRQISDRADHDNEWRLILIGSCNFLDRPSVQYYRMLRELALGCNVEVLVNQPRQVVDAAYRNSAIYVHATGLDVPASLPDRHEHFGIAPFEAMANGCLPVVYAKGGPADQVRRAGEGLCFADFSELVEVMSTAIARVEGQMVPYDTISKAAKGTYETNLERARHLLLMQE